MTDHTHDAQDLFGGSKTLIGTLTDQVLAQVVFLGLQDGCLMQADVCGVEVHVEEDRIRVLDPGGQPEMGRQIHRGVCEDAVKATVPLPELSVLKIFRSIIRGLTVKVDEVAAKQTCQNDNTTKRRKRSSAIRSHSIGQEHGLLAGSAAIILFIRSR